MRHAVISHGGIAGGDGGHPDLEGGGLRQLTQCCNIVLAERREVAIVDDDGVRSEIGVLSHKVQCLAQTLRGKAAVGVDMDAAVALHIQAHLPDVGKLLIVGQVSVNLIVVGAHLLHRVPHGDVQHTLTAQQLVQGDAHQESRLADARAGHHHTNVSLSDGAFQRLLQSPEGTALIEFSLFHVSSLPSSCSYRTWYRFR